MTEIKSEILKSDESNFGELKSYTTDNRVVHKYNQLHQID